MTLRLCLAVLMHHRGCKLKPNSLPILKHALARPCPGTDVTTDQITTAGAHFLVFSLGATEPRHITITQQTG